MKLQRLRIPLHKMSSRHVTKPHLLLCLLLFVTPYVTCSHETERELMPTYADTRRLMKDLFDHPDYDPRIRPVINQSYPVNVHALYSLFSIVDFDESRESLLTSGYLQLSWHVPFLAWNKTEYNGLSHLHVPQNLLWKPDVELWNSVTDLQRNTHENLNIWLYSSGSVFWEPVQILHSTCDVNIKYFPFDTQTCNLRFTAWSYRKSYVNLTYHPDYSTSTYRYDESPSWELIGTSINDVVDSYDTTVVVTLTLKRRSSFYTMNIIIPILMLSILTVFVHVLPVSSGERASYAITVFLSFAVFLTLISDQLPANSNVLSYLGIYLIIMLTVSTLTVLITLLQQRLVTLDSESDPPPKICELLYNLMMFIRCKNCRKRAQIYTVDDEDGNKADPTKKITWDDLVNTMDFFCFWAALLTFLLSTLVIGRLILSN